MDAWTVSTQSTMMRGPCGPPHHRVLFLQKLCCCSCNYHQNNQAYFQPSTVPYLRTKSLDNRSIFDIFWEKAHTTMDTLPNSLSGIPLGCYKVFMAKETQHHVSENNLNKSLKLHEEAFGLHEYNVTNSDLHKDRKIKDGHGRTTIIAQKKYSISRDSGSSSRSPSPQRKCKGKLRTECSSSERKERRKKSKKYKNRRSRKHKKDKLRYKKRPDFHGRKKGKRHKKSSSSESASNSNSDSESSPETIGYSSEKSADEGIDVRAPRPNQKSVDATSDSVKTNSEAQSSLKRECHRSPTCRRQVTCMNASITSSASTSSDACSDVLSRPESRISETYHPSQCRKRDTPSPPGTSATTSKSNGFLNLAVASTSPNQNGKLPSSPSPLNSRNRSRSLSYSSAEQPPKKAPVSPVAPKYPKTRYSSDSSRSPSPATHKQPASYRSKSKSDSKSPRRRHRSRSRGRSKSFSRARSRKTRSRSRSYRRRASPSRSHSHDRCYSRSHSRGSRRRESRSPSIRRRPGSPSHLDKRRITSARKRPVPYHRPTPPTPSSLSSFSYRSYSRSRSRSQSRERSCSRSRSRSASHGRCYC